MLAVLRSHCVRSTIHSPLVSLNIGLGGVWRSTVLSCRPKAAVPSSIASARTVVVFKGGRRRQCCPNYSAARRVLCRELQGAPAMAWACPRCTFLNQGGGAVCGMCALDSPQPVVDSGPEWSCPTCTFLNHFVASTCEMCNNARPEFAELERNQAADRSARSTAKFRPLRSSQRSGDDKARSPDTAGLSSEISAPTDLRTLVKESEAISRKRKAVAVDEDAASNASEMDGITSSKERQGIPAEGEMSNSWLRQLHAERMARINNSMASSDLEKNNPQSAGQASGLGSDSSEERRSATAASPCTNVDTVLILTYNVWFREDLELQARMNAIGKIIQLRQPHVICLQEVTPTIYSIFQKASWWSLYKCSMSPALVAKRAYFCIQLSRLPVLSFHRNPYSNSIMGRELAMADLDYGRGEQLVVATTHLESPCPAPPAWDQMFSKERVFQASEALKLMKDLPNVVFSGDMNWDDKLDGPPPLPPGWFDAWVKLHANKPGLTYDSKANQMLAGSRLQKRLDRMFCHLRDFKVSSIEMVGTQPITGLSYQKERKVKGQVQLITLPVLPSDHFGLLLQLQKVDR